MNESCDLPQYECRCPCGHVATWIIPRPHMLQLVRELAQRMGWETQHR